MYKTQLCLGTNSQFGIGLKERIKLFKDTGFEAFFVNWENGIDLKAINEYAKELGMIFQSVHAPFGGAAAMWSDGDEAGSALSELLMCLTDCAENHAPIMVCHAIIGFDKHSPNEIGIKNYKTVVDKAAQLGVKIAFENTEGEEYLEAVMNAFKDSANVGFCLDTGHEMCYNRSKDMLSLYGDRLICTHINDNLGIKDYGGSIIWTDDLHLLPFDGIGDWEGVAKRLNTCGYEGILTFELNKKSKPDRHENDAYDRMAIEDYITEAYKRACRVAMLKEKNKKCIKKPNG